MRRSVPHCLIMTAGQVSVNIYISCFLHNINVTQQQPSLLSGSQGLQELVKDCLSPVFLLLGLVAIPPEPEEILTMPLLTMISISLVGLLNLNIVRNELSIPHSGLSHQIYPCCLFCCRNFGLSAMTLFLDTFRHLGFWGQGSGVRGKRSVVRKIKGIQLGERK